MLSVFRFNRIPGPWFGILFFWICITGLADSVPTSSVPILAGELFNEANWAVAQLEAHRVLILHPADEMAAAIEAAAQLRQTPSDEQAFTSLLCLSTQAGFKEARAWALSEVGFTQWARNDKEQALATLTKAFQESQDRQVRARASFGACILLSRTKASPDIQSYWRTNLVQCLPTWNKEIRRAGAIRPTARRRTFWSWPGELMVSFYRTQIAPAIGARCVLEPSCSEYFRQACRKNGWLGFPMMGDRFIREPSVVKEAEKPVVVNGATRYADPVDDHVPF
ncbi:MAG TPA: hypothetical protein DCZ95_15280 [Verrucomicrobia bacterium]|nr:MAG: hypothetical protein A2X46_19035 [Lentisphaerae bacterium GWF2_57_35]HBA85447.1 hypothetical protein [Verrucomicrobiota bacterium]